MFVLASMGFVKAQNNTFYDETHQKHRKAVPYQYVREDDVIWRHRVWQEINFAEKINQFFYFPQFPSQGRINFMKMLDDAVMEGTIPAYRSNDDDCITPMTKEDLLAFRSKPEAMEFADPDDPDLTYDTVVEVPVDLNEVRKLRIKEDWYIDKQRGIQDVRILAICPVLYNIKTNDETGEETIEVQPLYWVRFEDCRDVFVQTEVYNMFASNDVMRLSYDDVFMKRVFHPVIYKESNDYDRRVSDYKEGIDALLEAETIKEKVFEFEQGMWEY